MVDHRIVISGRRGEAMVQKRILILLILLFVPTRLVANEGKEIIEKMIHKLRGHVNIAEYEMTVTRPNWTRSLKIKVWDDRKDSRVFIRILEPARDAGTSFLRLGYNLWNYMPKVEKVMKIPPSMMLQPWMGSDFTNDDLVKESSYIDDYDHQITGHETVDNEKVLKIELIPHPRAPVIWGKVIFWVREKDDLPVREHFLDEKGRLIKELVFSDYKTLDGILLPTRWEMTPVTKQGQKTVLNLLSIDFDPSPPIPESVFTERNLRP
jgi:outer membrane lipoprotein-sorting protein